MRAVVERLLGERLRGALRVAAALADRLDDLAVVQRARHAVRGEHEERVLPGAHLAATEGPS